MSIVLNLKSRKLCWSSGDKGIKGNPPPFLAAPTYCTFLFFLISIPCEYIAKYYKLDHPHTECVLSFGHHFTEQIKQRNAFKLHKTKHEHIVLIYSKQKTNRIFPGGGSFDIFRRFCQKKHILFVFCVLYPRQTPFFGSIILSVAHLPEIVVFS